jgi:hypothetical protein
MVQKLGINFHEVSALCTKFMQLLWLDFGTFSMFTGIHCQTNLGDMFIYDVNSKTN